jgi:hypothetical protein
VVVVALPIGWFRTVFRCGASSGVGTLAERFSLDRSGSQIEKFIDFGSNYRCSQRHRFAYVQNKFPCIEHNSEVAVLFRGLPRIEQSEPFLYPASQGSRVNCDPVSHVRDNISQSTVLQKPLNHSHGYGSFIFDPVVAIETHKYHPNFRRHSMSSFKSGKDLWWLSMTSRRRPMIDSLQRDTGQLYYLLYPSILVEYCVNSEKFSVFVQDQNKLNAFL